LGIGIGCTNSQRRIDAAPPMAAQGYLVWVWGQAEKGALASARVSNLTHFWRGFADD
jgi:hypothetical protein